MSVPKHPANELELKLSGLVIHDEHNKTMTEPEEDNKRRHEDRGMETSKDTEREGFRPFLSICNHFVKDLNNYGMFVIDSFLGSERGDLVYEEVVNLHKAGLFKEGQLVRNDTQNRDIRGDEIIWLIGNEPQCPNIRYLITEIDRIVITSNKLKNNGKLGQYRIDGRTKAMVACYPGNGAHYVKHVDNPNKDGRVLTAIYYLNKNWIPEIHGGTLRIFPNEERRKAADIDPKFDRMLFFWSDRRNPHEVQPSFRTRYAITIWYFDAEERLLAQKKTCQSDSDDEKKVESRS